MRLLFAGAPILEIFPVVPLQGNMAVGVGALSHAGQFNLTVVTDRDLVPDRDVFVDAVGRWWADVTETAVAAGNA